MSLTQHRPGTILRALFRAPIPLFRAGLGGLLGGRFLLLRHTGRRSGKAHDTVIEVMRHDQATDTYFVASGWGNRSDWYRNVRHNPSVQITVGRKTSSRRAEILSPETAGEEFFRYAETYPAAFRYLTKVMTGEPAPATREACRELGECLPVIAFRTL